MKISPSNTEQGYILRRLIRRIIRLFKKVDVNTNYLCKLAEILIDQYSPVYPELGENREFSQFIYHFNNSKNITIITAPQTRPIIIELVKTKALTHFCSTFLI